MIEKNLSLGLVCGIRVIMISFTVYCKNMIIIDEQ